MYKSISLKDPNFVKKMVDNYMADGLVVINDVLTDNECFNYFDSIVDNFVKLGTGIKKEDIGTWTDHNLPPMSKPGLFQCLMANQKEIWSLRSHPNVKFIFEEIYSALRGKRIDEFIVSGDGINIKPNSNPLHSSQDWPHLDQSTRNDTYKCVQGQIVLTNTTASFVASPKSHLIFDEILNELGVQNNTTNWIRIKNQDVNKIKNMVTKIGGEWQIPILCKKGSMILWSSTLIHSARLQTQIELPSTDYMGWRGVVYICYRPKNEFTQKQLIKRIKAFEENRTTNHWGTKIFPKKPGYYSNKDKIYHELITKIINKPETIYSILGKPDLDQTQQKLLGY